MDVILPEILKSPRKWDEQTFRVFGQLYNTLYAAGYKPTEIRNKMAELMGISLRTSERYIQFARQYGAIELTAAEANAARDERRKGYKFGVKDMDLDALRVKAQEDVEFDDPFVEVERPEEVEEEEVLVEAPKKKGFFRRFFRC